MASDDPGLWSQSSARSAGQSIYDVIVDVILTGIVVILPLVVTIYILKAAFDVITDVLSPIISILQWAGIVSTVKFGTRGTEGLAHWLAELGLYTNLHDFLTEIVALFVLVVLIVALGAVARFRYGERVIDYFDAVVGRIPGVGALYKSFRRMGDVMLETGVENFRSVKLVEFPHDDVYVLGFETAESPLTVQGAAGEDGMVTLFLPLAPNPVMGGFLAHFPERKVSDVDMTVEEAVQTIITSGIAADDPDAGEYRQLSDEEMRQLSDPSAFEAAETDDPER